jgi:hypothetical protein
MPRAAGRGRISKRSASLGLPAYGGGVAGESVLILPSFSRKPSAAYGRRSRTRRLTSLDVDPRKHVVVSLTRVMRGDCRNRSFRPSSARRRTAIHVVDQFPHPRLHTVIWFSISRKPRTGSSPRPTRTESASSCRPAGQVRQQPGSGFRASRSVAAFEAAESDLVAVFTEAPNR